MLAGLALSVTTGGGVTACPVVLGGASWLVPTPPQPIRVPASAPQTPIGRPRTALRSRISVVCIGSGPVSVTRPHRRKRTRPSDHPTEQGGGSSRLKPLPASPHARNIVDPEGLGVRLRSKCAGNAGRTLAWGLWRETAGLRFCFAAAGLRGVEIRDLKTSFKLPAAMQLHPLSIKSQARCPAPVGVRSGGAGHRDSRGFRSLWPSAPM